MKGMIESAAVLGLSALAFFSGQAEAQIMPTPRWTAANCNTYRPGAVIWNNVRLDVISYLNRQNCNLQPEGIPCKRLAAVFIRLSAHDALTMPGGADGSVLLAAAEQSFEHNQKPFPFVHHARTALQPIVTKYGISWADAIAVAGAVATEWAATQDGRPRVVVRSLRVGRCDSTAANVDTLPAANLTFSDYTNWWLDRGVTVTDADALMGVHTMMEDGSSRANGVLQYQWNIRYYRDLRAGTITPNGDGTVTWTNGRWRYTVNDAHLAGQNVAKGCSACPFAGLHNANFQLYANNGGRWDRDYDGAYNRMMSRGALFSSQSTTANLGGGAGPNPGPGPNPAPRPSARPTPPPPPPRRPAPPPRRPGRDASEEEMNKE